MFSDEESGGFDQCTPLESGIEIVKKRTRRELGAMHACGKVVIHEAAPLDLAARPMCRTRSVGIADPAAPARTLLGGHAGSAIRTAATNQFIVDSIVLHSISLV